MGSDIKLSSDILQPIGLDEWPSLQELLKVNWPFNLNYYNWIENSIKWKREDPDLALQIYCPHGKYQDDATFVGISSFGRFEVYIFTKDPSGKRLHDALVQTSRIDWSREVMFTGVHGLILSILLSALSYLRIAKGIELNTVIPRWFYIRPLEDCTNLEIVVPEEYYLGELNLSHLPIIHSLWPHIDREQTENTLKHIGAMLRLNKCVGIFLKEGNRLISWLLQNEWHGLGILHSLESYRRRGHAYILANALCKQISKNGITPICYITPGNAASQNLSRLLGWQPVAPHVWIVMKKKPLISTIHGKVDSGPRTHSSL